MKKTAFIFGMISSFFFWGCNSPDTPSLDPSRDPEKIATLNVNSDLSKIPLDSILRSGKIKLVTKDFTKIIKGIKPSTNTHLQDSEVFASDSIVFILRNKVDLTFSVIGKEGRNFQYVVSRDKNHILDLKAAYSARKAKASIGSKKIQDNNMSHYTEQFASNSYCFASKEIPTKNQDENSEQIKNLCGFSENEKTPLDMTNLKDLSGKKIPVIGDNQKNSNSTPVTIKLLFFKNHGTLWHEVDWAFGRVVNSMRNVAPEVQFNLVRAYNRIDYLPLKSGRDLIHDFHEYISRKRHLEKDPFYMTPRTIFVAVGYDLGWTGVSGEVKAIGMLHKNPSSYGTATSEINLFSLSTLVHEISHIVGARHANKWHWQPTWWFFGYWWQDIMAPNPTFSTGYHGDTDNIRRMRLSL